MARVHPRHPRERRPQLAARLLNPQPLGPRLGCVQCEYGGRCQTSPAVAVNADSFYRKAFGDTLIDYLVMLRRSKLKRHEAALTDSGTILGADTDGTNWEMIQPSVPAPGDTASSSAIGRDPYGRDRT